MTRKPRPCRAETGEDQFIARETMQIRIANLFGQRYVDCRLSNWEEHGTDDEKARQRRVVAAVRGYG